MNFVGKAKRLEDLDISRTGHSIGAGEDEIHAFLEVETRGGGFDRAGRPKMLFEPHIFYKRLSGAERDWAVSEGLAYKKWGTQRYPKDSYPRLEQAMNINKRAALESASWGLGQVMGFNYAAAGYSSAEEMVTDFLDSEASHLQAAINFVVTNGLDDELRRHDWAGFARGYNGPGYKKNRYDAKLAAAYAKWRKIPDTPFKIDRNEVDPNPPDEGPDFDVAEYPTLQNGDTGPDVKVLQLTLASLGYFSGKIDGQFGRLTRGAVLAFQADNGLQTDGIAGPVTRNAMKTAEPKPERDVTMDDLADSGTLKDLDEVDRVADVGGVAGVGGAVAIANQITDATETAQDAAEGASGLLDTLTSLVTAYWPALALLGGVAVLYLMFRGKTQQTRRRRLRDARTGRHLGR